MHGAVEIQSRGHSRLTAIDLINGLDELREAADALNADTQTFVYVHAVVTENGVTRTVPVEAIRLALIERDSAD